MKITTEFLRGFCCFRGLDCGLWESDVESAAAEHDECYEVGGVVGAVGHADGDLDAVVERLEPGVGAAELDGPEDVRAPSPDPPREFDYLGDTAAGRPEHPMVQFRLGLVDRMPEQGPQQFPELPCTVEPALGIRVPQRVERFGLPVGQIAGVLQYRVFDAAHALRGLLIAVAARLVPQALADLVERVAHPADDVEPGQHAFGVRAVLLDA